MTKKNIVCVCVEKQVKTREAFINDLRSLFIEILDIWGEIAGDCVLHANFLIIHILTPILRQK